MASRTHLRAKKTGMEVSNEPMIETALEYHLKTSYRRDQMSGHYLDWANQPTVFKDYHGLQPQILPRDFDLPRTSLRNPEVRLAPNVQGVGSQFEAAIRNGAGGKHYRGKK